MNRPVDERPRRPRDDAPRHPHLAAALLMIGIVLFLVLASVVSVL